MLVAFDKQLALAALQQFARFLIGHARHDDAFGDIAHRR